MPDPVIAFDDNARAELMALRAQKKFEADFFYPGAPTEALRLAAEGQVVDCSEIWPTLPLNLHTRLTHV